MLKCVSAEGTLEAQIAPYVFYQSISTYIVPPFTQCLRLQPL